MLICDELQMLKQKLLDRSSLKERAFYQFLAGEPFTQPPENDLTEIEQICLSVFCADVPAKKDLSTLTEAQRKKRPISGMHYTNNLIELCAMARDNNERERANLESYCDNRSTRDFFILNSLFQDISCNPPRSQGPIDQMAAYLYEGTSPPEGWKPILLKALQETSDLMDVYVIEQGYLQAMDDSPIVHQVADILYVRNAIACYVAKTEGCVKRTIAVVSIILLVPVSFWLVPLIVKNWNEAEPIFFVIQISILLGSLFAVFSGFAPDKIKFINSRREKVIDWVFRRKGFKRSELKKRLAALEEDANE